MIWAVTPDRLMQGEGEIIHPQGNGVPLQLVGDAGVIFEIAGRGLHIALGLAQRLAAVEGIRRRLIRARIAADERRGAPRSRRPRAPPAGLRARARRARPSPAATSRIDIGPVGGGTSGRAACPVRAGSAGVTSVSPSQRVAPSARRYMQRQRNIVGHLSRISAPQPKRIVVRSGFPRSPHPAKPRGGPAPVMLLSRIAGCGQQPAGLHAASLALQPRPCKRPSKPRAQCHRPRPSFRPAGDAQGLPALGHRGGRHRLAPEGRHAARHRSRRS